MITTVASTGYRLVLFQTKRCHLEVCLCIRMNCTSLTRYQRTSIAFNDHNNSPCNLTIATRSFTFQRRRHQRQRKARTLSQQQSEDEEFADATRLQDHETTTTTSESQHQQPPQKPWWRYITIWPDPHGYDPEWEKTQRFPWPNSYKDFKQALDLAWKEYLWTFEGWLLPDSGRKYGEKNDDDNNKEMADAIKNAQDAVRNNVENNIKYLKEEAMEVQKETGIYTLDHLKEWAASQMKLATECVQEFMVGYRQGRDEEVEKMVNQYFQDVWDDGDQNKPEEKKVKKRRKPKRRIRTAD